MSKLPGKRVLACLDDSPAADAVLATATNVARAMGAELDVISVVPPDGSAVRRSASMSPGGRASRSPTPRVVVGPVEATLVDELEQDDVVLGVLGSRALAAQPDLLGHVARAVVTRSRRSLIVVPPGAEPLTGEGQRFLVPLDGRSRTSRAVAPVLAALIEPMGTIVPLHVFDDAHVPMFVSSPHDREVLADEFAARHLGPVVSRTERPRLRLGAPVDEILAAIRRDEADAVVVCWSQHLDGGRAAVIRGLLADGSVPVVLHPIDVARAGSEGRPGSV